jgi:hypothetical protein
MQVRDLPQVCEGEYFQDSLVVCYHFLPQEVRRGGITAF